MFYGETTGERLKKLRKEKGEIQEVTAKALSIERSVLSNYENNVRTPDIEKIQAFADYFNVTVDFLLCRSDVKKADTTLQAVSEYMGLSDEAIRRIRLLKNVPGYIDIFDEFICDRAFEYMLSAFAYAIGNIIELETDENSDIDVEKLREDLQQEEFEDFLQRLNADKPNMIEYYERLKEEQIDVCSVKMIKVARLFLSEE